MKQSLRFEKQKNKKGVRTFLLQLFPTALVEHCSDCDMIDNQGMAVLIESSLFLYSVLNQKFCSSLCETGASSVE